MLQYYNLVRLSKITYRKLTAILNLQYNLLRVKLSDVLRTITEKGKWNYKPKNIKKNTIAITAFVFQNKK
jgi:hypothetical protein